MSYKNQKKNKAHIKELRRDPSNWRNRKGASSLLTMNNPKRTFIERFLGLK